MRLLKLGVYYPAYLEQFYARRPSLAAQPFAAQHRALIGDCFGSSDFWTAALSKLGYETCDLVANAEPMQKMWAQERGLAFDEKDWLFGITAAQTEAFRPEVLIVADYSIVTSAFIKHLRELCPSLRLVLGWCGAPYRDGAIFGECDVVLSCVPELVAHFRDAGHRSRHVNHAFEPRILQKIDTTAAPSADFVFIGSVFKSDQFHIERERILSRLVEETGLQIWSSASRQSTTQRPGTELHDNSADDGNHVIESPTRRSARRTPSSFVGGAARRTMRLVRGVARRAAPSLSSSTEVDARIAMRARAPLFGLEMFQRLRDSRVALNTHIDISPVSASNMRLFEATGVGTCLLTDWKANLSELFEPDAEIVAYRDAAECVEKVKYLLGHEAELRRISDAGQRRTLRDHNFDARAARIDAIIREALSSS